MSCELIGPFPARPADQNAGDRQSPNDGETMKLAIAERLR